jgi:hypothetical protein
VKLVKLGAIGGRVLLADADDAWDDEEVLVDLVAHGDGQFE